MSVLDVSTQSIKIVSISQTSLKYLATTTVSLLSPLLFQPENGLAEFVDKRAVTIVVCTLAKSVIIVLFIQDVRCGKMCGMEKISMEYQKKMR